MRRRRMSDRWAAVFDQVGGPPAGSQWVYIADRESDCYETIRRVQRHGVDFVIRACQDRRLGEEAGYLRETLARTATRGQMTVELRARGGRGARQALVEGRSTTVSLRGPWRPGGRGEDLSVNVVEVREVEVPSQAEPLHWILLTSLPCERWAQVQRIVGRYASRWLVEEYHKALKSGTQVETSQLERAYRLQSLVGVLALVAVRLLNTKLLAGTRPERPVAASEFGPEALAILAEKFGQPPDGWTNGTLLVAVARLGGF